MRAQNVKNTIEKFPPSSKIFFLRPRRRRGRHQSSEELVIIKEKEQWCASGGGSEKHLNVIRVVATAADSRCCLASFHLKHQNKTTEEQKDEHRREFAALSSLPWSLSPIFGINPNKSVATFVEGFNRGSVGSAREPLWMEV